MGWEGVGVARFVRESTFYSPRGIDNKRTIRNEITGKKRRSENSLNKQNENTT